MKISAICPVYNEGQRIIEVIKILKESDFIEEIIFVDDGSTDDTFEILKKFRDKRIKIFRLRKNRGKGFALGFGIKKSKGEVLIFLDSDLKDFKKDHLKILISPILKRKAKCVIGVPIEKKRRLIRPWEIYLSGERAYFRKDLIFHLPKFFKLRYGVEIFLNSLFLPEETKIVFLLGAVSPSKFEKRDLFEATREYLKEIKEIFEDAKRVNLSPLLAKDLLKGYIKEMMAQFGRG